MYNPHHIVTTAYPPWQPPTWITPTLSWQPPTHCDNHLTAMTTTYVNNPHCIVTTAYPPWQPPTCVTHPNVTTIYMYITSLPPPPTHTPHPLQLYPTCTPTSHLSDPPPPTHTLYCLRVKVGYKWKMLHLPVMVEHSVETCVMGLHILFLLAHSPNMDFQPTARQQIKSMFVVCCLHCFVLDCMAYASFVVSLLAKFSRYIYSFMVLSWYNKTLGTVLPLVWIQTPQNNCVMLLVSVQCVQSNCITYFEHCKVTFFPCVSTEMFCVCSACIWSPLSSILRVLLWSAAVQGFVSAVVSLVL